MDDLLEYYKNLRLDYKTLEGSFDEKSVHDKRVIIRRISSLFKASKQSMNPRIKKTFKIFGKLRDIQMQILIVEKYNFISVEYLNYLKTKELKSIEKLGNYATKNPLEFDEFLISKKNIKRVSKSLTKDMKKMKKLIEKINKPKEFHDFRIVFKKFRYDFEIFCIIKNIDLNEIRDLKCYQDFLGEIQDLEVFINSYNKFCNRNIKNLRKEKNEKIKNFGYGRLEFLDTCISLLSRNGKQINSV